MPNHFLAVFAKSPIKPLEEHIKKVFDASLLLLPFFDAVFLKDWEQAAEVRKALVALEKDADKLKRDIRVHLPRGLFLPVDRTDLLELVSQQDKIANKAKDITGRVLGRELEIPAPIQVEFKAYLQRCIDAVELACEAINELDELQKAIKAVMSNYSCFPSLPTSSVRRDDLQTSEHELVEALSDRELTVLQKLALGLGNKEIAEDMLLSHKTISTYKTRLKEKLRMSSVVHLSKFAQRNHLI